MHEESIFHKALEIESADERKAYLDQTCAGDAELRQRIDALLKAHDDPGTYLKKPDLDHDAATLLPSPVSERPVTEQPGSLIGPYKLLQQIGEGGMGVVYMAEQQEPVRRKVALKIIKPGMDTDLVIARFEAERQALALMEHQNIARVLDAGATATGRPYFVMELVRGTPITSYCDKNRLTPRKRLELFIDVCHAIQHAHQKGVIHRDIKPSNVLVCSYDGEPVPKVIDFGVAKATQQRLTDKTLFTLHGQVVGTLEYMSPEQAEMSQIDIDTRSDIYSLGVLLYELLTGSTPISKEKLREAAFVEILRSICEDEPAKPSTRLSESADALSTISAQRRTDPKKLGALIRGDLDWIVMKSMEKDRTRRYDSATAFAADVERYLQDEPVAACPPSAAYKFRKLLRRNRLSISVAAAFVFLLLAATVVSTGLAVVASTAKAEAVLRTHMLMNAEKEIRKAKDLEADARQKAEFDRDRALLAEEQAQDTVARSLFEQARAVRLAGRNGHRWRALELLRRAEALRTRERKHALVPVSIRVTDPGGKAPSTTQDQISEQTRSKTQADQLPQRVELRNEAVAALLSLDARIEQQWNSMNQAISPNGRFAILTYMNPNARPAHSEVRLIDLRSGEELRRWNNQEIGLAAALALSADGKQLAAGKKEVALYDTTTGDKIRTLQWPTTNDSALDAGNSTDDNPMPANWEGVNIIKLAFSNDGHRLAAATFNRNADKSVLHWNLSESEPATIIANVAQRTPMVDLSFSTSGQLLAFPSSSLPGDVTIWDLVKAKVRLSIKAPDPTFGLLGFSPDGHLVALLGASEDAGQMTLYVWDIKNNKLKQTIATGPSIWSTSPVFSPDGRHVAIGGLKGSVSVFDLASGQEELQLEHRAAVMRLSWSEDGRSLFTGGSGSLKKWDLALSRPITIRQLGKARMNVGSRTVFSTDGKRVVVLGHQPEISVYAWPSCKLERTIAVSNTFLWAKFRSDGRQMLVGGYAGISIYNIETGELENEFKPDRNRGGAYISPALTPDGRVLALDPKRRGVWNVETGKLVWETDNNEPGLHGVNLSSDGRFVANWSIPLGISKVTSQSSGSVDFWDLATGDKIQSIAEAAKPVMTKFSPHGRWFATSHSSSYQDLLNSQSPGAENIFLASAEAVTDWRVRVWDVKTGQVRIDSSGPGVERMAFSPETGLFAIRFRNRLVEVWNLANGEQLFQWQLSTPAAPEIDSVLEFTADGKHLAASIGSGQFELLQLDSINPELKKIGLGW